MSEAIELASSLPLPMPAFDDENNLRRTLSKRQSSKGQRSQPSTTEITSDNVAPYQALPVQGPLISRNYTPALDVLEPDTLHQQASNGG